MKKFILFTATLLCSHIAFATAAQPSEQTKLSGDTLVSALVDPNAETTEFSATRGATPSNAAEYEAVYLNKVSKIVPKSKHEKDRSMYYSIDATYPQITGKSYNEAEAIFNKRVNAIIDEEMRQFKNSVQLDMPHMKTLPKEVRNNTFKIDYDIDVIHELALVSIRFTIQGMQAGRAHPYRSHRVLNFDLVHNKELALDDLFKSDAKYLDVLAKYSSNKLQKTVNEKDKWMIEEGAKAIAKNYKNWNIEKGALLITFDEYQVAPYVYGPQEIEIPYTEIQQLLSPQAQIISSIKDNTANVG
jgi:hypothetical protein